MLGKTTSMIIVLLLGSAPLVGAGLASGVNVTHLAQYAVTPAPHPFWELRQGTGDEALFHFELARGGDPISFMRQHHDRIPYLHLKSVAADIQKQVAVENIPFATAVGMDMFCELSEGMVDFLALRDVLREIGYDGWAIVEQDMYLAPFDKPLPIAKRTRAYLREIGIG